MIKTKGYYKGFLPIYITEKEGVLFLEGTNWFWERILTWCFNLDLYMGNIEEIDFK